MREATSTGPAVLDIAKSRKFLRKLADDSFIAIVVTEDGELQIFTKGIEQAHLDRIRNVLKEIVEGD